jgi:hypothetical protein
VGKIVRLTEGKIKAMKEIIKTMMMIKVALKT